jgi:ABC-type multidrug transport system ATPase subunit
MKQKLALCCALVHRPYLLFLDEPTTGVDAVSRREFWDLLGALRASGLTILVSTPYMDEADRCDRVALIHGGRILAVDAPAASGRSYGHALVAVRDPRRFALLTTLRAHPDALSAYPFGAELHFTSRRPAAEADRVALELRAWLAGRGFPEAQASAIAPGIEDTFMARMGETAVAEAGA